jgi:hypothetical protein
MNKPNILIDSINSLIKDNIIAKYSDIQIVNKKDDSMELIEVVDKNDLRVKLDFVLWNGSNRVTVLLDNQEVLDENYNISDSFLADVCVLIFNKVVKIEKYSRMNKLIYKELKFSLMINGEIKIISDRKRFKLINISKTTTVIKEFLPW